jgi:hypothetical protein
MAYAKDLVGDLSVYSEYVRVNPKHNGNYVAIGNEVSKQEVELLMGTPAEKRQIEVLAKELKSLDSKRIETEVEIALSLARLWYQTGKGGFYTTKKALKNAIKTLKALEEMKLALAKLINA